MQTVAPVLMIVGLGGVAGLVGHRRWPYFWRVTTVAALVATVAWVIGVYLLLVLTAPGELGPPLLEPIVMTFVTAYIGALAAGLALRATRYSRHREHGPGAHANHAGTQ